MEAENGNGKLVANLVHFGRILRSCGLPVGTGTILHAVEAVSLIGLHNREDFYWTLHAVFVNHPRQRLIFDQAFHIFWKNPRILEKSISNLLPQVRVPPDAENSRPIVRRLSESLLQSLVTQETISEDDQQVDFKASLTYSNAERFMEVDFESMSQDEMRQAKKAIETMRVAFHKAKTRRYRVHQSGERVDLRNTMRQSMRCGAGEIALIRRKRRFRTTPVVVLCDISGSMSEYSRMVLYFAHVLMMCRADVWCFVFGTRLTNITRQLRSRDVDVAMDKVSDSVLDWHGGTRIGDCLKTFNNNWIRRLPMYLATVLVVTDGLDRSENNNLKSQISLLHRSCQRLIWLNPLLRYEHFEPRVSGVRAMLPHVDAFLPVHNLISLYELAEKFSSGAFDNDSELRKSRTLWKNKMNQATLNQPQSADVL